MRDFSRRAKLARRGSGACLIALGLACGGGNEYVEPPPPSVTVAQPLQKTVTDYLNFTGTTEAIASVEIRARVAGYLLTENFEEGSTIEQGTLLYQIDPDEYRAEVARMEASVERAKASLEIAEARLKRLERAGRTRAVSEIEVLESRATRDEAIATLAAQRAELTNARLNLSYTRVTAPMDGRVGRTHVDPGNLVGSGENTLLTTMVQYDPMYVVFDMSERDLLTLIDTQQTRTGGGNDRDSVRAIPVEVGRANDQDFPYVGHLDFVDQGLDPDTGTFLMRGSIPNSGPRRLLPGMFVKVRVPITESEGALLVSERALGAGQGGRYLLVVGEGDVVEQRRVEVGAQVGSMRVIKTGIAADDWVIVEGILRARPGARVSPERDGEPPEATPSPNAGSDSS